MKHILVAALKAAFWTGVSFGLGVMLSILPLWVTYATAIAIAFVVFLSLEFPAKKYLDESENLKDPHET